jgi:hypothetical protein
MNVEIGIEAMRFLFLENINRIFVAVCIRKMFPKGVLFTVPFTIVVKTVVSVVAG